MLPSSGCSYRLRVKEVGLHSFCISAITIKRGIGFPDQDFHTATMMRMVRTTNRTGFTCPCSWRIGRVMGEGSYGRDRDVTY